jgi:hypothetical protein
MHEYLMSLNGRERQHDLIARADRQRLARQVGTVARAPRAGRTGRRPRPAWRPAAALVRLRLRLRAAR